MLSGTSAKQLAFLAGRAMTWYRPEYHCMLYYPALEDLRELVEAALRSRHRRLAGRAVVETRCDAPLRRLGGDERAAIGEAATRLGARGEVALEHWVRSAELTAARAGLLLCGELKTAVARRAVAATPPRSSVGRARDERSRRLLRVAGARGAARAVPEVPSPSIVPAPRGA